MSRSTRTEPFSDHEWRQFSMALRYNERALGIAYEMSARSEPDYSDDISEQVAGVRWYAVELAHLDALLYRAAGLRKGENACADQELRDLRTELSTRYPQLYDLRNALFAHPPFVHGLLTEDEVLFFSEQGVHRSSAEGGTAHAIVDDPMLSQPWVSSLIERFRNIIMERHRAAMFTE